MERFLILLSALIVLSNCTTTAQKGKGGSALSPAPKDRGTISYNPNGLKEMVEVRHQNALTKIAEACGGKNKYVILKESVHDKDPTDGDIALFGSSKVKSIDYKCK
jgi:hypothetical protein